MKVLKNDSWSRGVHPEERPTAYQLSDLDNDGAHGSDGVHSGYRCYQCAQQSGSSILLASDSGEYWQNKQLDWQEECDVIQSNFDLEVANHFPLHLAIDCKSCPKTGVMPKKPEPPAERALGQ